MEFLFIDGEKICIYKDGEVSEYESGFIEKYKEATLRSIKNSEWRKKSRTEMLLNEDFFVSNDDEFNVKINSAWLVNDEKEILYSFTVNETSGIYRKFLDDDKKLEGHVISSNDLEFSNLFYDEQGTLATIKRGEVTSDIAIFSKDFSDYKFVTGGDSLDENPYLHTDGKIYFNSYGVARDEVGNHLGYGASELYSLDIKTLKVEEILSSNESSLIKPTPWKNGYLMIKKPFNEKEKTNFFLDVLMIPIRILQGIVGFISAFVTFFSGKPLVSDTGKNSNGYNTRAKRFENDEKRLFVANQMINVEKEMKKNKKDEYPSFIPRSWKLVHVKKDKEDVYEQKFLSGVADYCLLDENNIIVTNGKYIFHILKEDNFWTSKAILKTDFCLKVFPMPKKDSPLIEELFSYL